MNDTIILRSDDQNQAMLSIGRFLDFFRENIFISISAVTTTRIEDDILVWYGIAKNIPTEYLNIPLCGCRVISEDSIAIETLYIIED